MQTTILEFMNMGGAEIGIVLIGLLLPFLLTLYSIIDILRSKFKDSNNKILFMILVVVAPVIGSIAYMLLRRSYKLPNKNDYKMPY